MFLLDKGWQKQKKRLDSCVVGAPPHLREFRRRSLEEKRHGLHGSVTLQAL